VWNPIELLHVGFRICPEAIMTLLRTQARGSTRRDAARDALQLLLFVLSMLGILYVTFGIWEDVTPSKLAELTKRPGASAPLPAPKQP
jgi:hypothetical protein